MSARVAGTAAAEAPRRVWPWLAAGGGALVVAAVVGAVVFLWPVQIDDDITRRNAHEIARLMEAQLDVELALVTRAR